MDPKAKQKALRMLSNGMYVVTSRSGDRFGGATFTWLSQASFKPLLIMAAVRRDSSLFKCMSESRVLALNILGYDQRDIAQKFFATTECGQGVMNGEPFVEGKTSAPILKNVPAFLECQVQKIVDITGVHARVIMEVVEAGFRNHARPLTIAESPWEYGG